MNVKTWAKVQMIVKSKREDGLLRSGVKIWAKVQMIVKNENRKQSMERKKCLFHALFFQMITLFSQILIAGSDKCFVKIEFTICLPDLSASV